MLKQKKHWILKNSNSLSGRDLISYLLQNRGAGEPEERFFSPNFEKDLHDPFLFRDMKKTVKRLLRAIAKKEKILIYGDYDADGVTSSAMLNKLLRSLRLDTEVYLPHRENEGYGMNKDVVKKFAEIGVSLVFSVDCGISNTEEVALANSLGMDVMIFDHHLPPATLPRAYAIINPKLPDEVYPFKDLSSGGIIFKFVQAFFKNEESKKIANSFGLYDGWEKWLLDLAAVSTICDSMPLVGENRILVKYGLMVISKSRNIGLKRLMETARLQPSAIDTEKVGFMIGPRINAAGRMEHADLAFDLLSTEDDFLAAKLAARLNQANTDRQKLVEGIMRQAREQLGKPNGQIACVAYNADWPAGIVGLVAGKIKDEYYRPAFIVGSSQKGLIGSGRSIDEIDIMEVMNKIGNSEILTKFGGHKMACGFSLTGESAVGEFSRRINEIISERLNGLEIRLKLEIDAFVPFERITESLIGELKQFAPFGQGNANPRFLAKNTEVVGVEPIGQTKKHIRSFMRDKNGRVWKVMGFGWNSNGSPPFESGQKLDIVYELSENEWNGNKEIQIQLIDARAI